MTTLTIPAAEGVVYYVRVHPPAAGSTDSGTLDLSHSPRTYPLQVARSGGQMANPPITDTPVWLSLNVFNGTPGATVNFTLDADPTVIGDNTFADDGRAIGCGVLLDDTVLAGEHDITATDTATGLTGVVTIEVISGPADRPVARGADATPTHVDTTQWVIEYPGVEVYVFAINPARMTSPHSPRVVTVEHSTAPDGQPLTWEGHPMATSWTFEGHVDTQAQYEALERFLGYSSRLYLTDHFTRTWVITLESVDFTASKSAINPWAYTYKAQALILGGPL